MEKHLLKSFCIMAIGIASFAGDAAAQDQPKIYTYTAATDTFTGVKFSSLPKEKQDSLRKEFAENGLKVEQDALVFFAKRKKGETSVLTEENGKVLQYSIPKGDIYLVPNHEGLKRFVPKGPQKLYITIP